MAITFNNVNLNKSLLLLDEGFRQVASSGFFAGKMAEIRVVLVEDRFSYYVVDKPIGRGVSLTVLTPEHFQLCLSWGGGAFVCKPMTAEEIKEQFIVLLNFLVDGTLPKMVVSNKQEIEGLDTILETAGDRPVDWPALIENMPPFNPSEHTTTEK